MPPEPSWRTARSWATGMVSIFSPPTASCVTAASTGTTARVRWAYRCHLGAGLIERCTFRAIRNVGVGATGGSQIHMYDCEFEPDIANNVLIEGLLVGSRNHLGGGSWATLAIHEALHHRLPRESHTQCRRVLSTRRFLGPEPVKQFLTCPTTTGVRRALSNWTNESTTTMTIRPGGLPL